MSRSSSSPNKKFHPIPYENRRKLVKKFGDIPYDFEIWPLIFVGGTMGNVTINSPVPTEFLHEPSMEPAWPGGMSGSPREGWVGEGYHGLEIVRHFTVDNAPSSSLAHSLRSYLS